MSNTLKQGDKSQTYAHRRKEEKKSALRDFLTGQKYIEAINRDLARSDISADELPVIKYKTETRLKLLSKVLPDLKAIDLTGDLTGTFSLVAGKHDQDL